MRILFVTRKYPPILGGMERYSKELYDALSSVADVELCANRRGNRALPSFLIAAAARIAKRGSRCDAIHLGDGLLAILLPVARAFAPGVPVTATVHGLDVTYANPIYRSLVLPRLRRADRIVCVSRNTRRLCLERGFAPERITVIPNGLAPSGNVEPRRPAGLPPGAENGRLLVTVGRLVPRKGQEWFIRNVLGRLGPEYVYAVAGEGPERPRIEGAIAEAGMAGRAFVLGSVTEAEKTWLLARARLFVMPNVPIEGDVEGFGLALAEAASKGLMSVASDLDGIPDAVIPGATGILAPPLDAAAFAAAIERAEPDRARVAAASGAFAWDRIVGRYIDEMKEAARRIE